MNICLHLCLTSYVLTQMGGWVDPTDKAANKPRPEDIKVVASELHEKSEQGEAVLLQLMEAKVKIAENKYREALGDIDRIETTLPEHKVVKFILRGECYEGLLENANAIAEYDKALSTRPQTPAAILHKAILDCISGDREEAKRLLNRYIALESGNPEAYYYLYLTDDDTRHRAVFTQKILVLEGSQGLWSTKLSKVIERERQVSKP